MYLGDIGLRLGSTGFGAARSGRMDVGGPANLGDQVPVAELPPRVDASNPFFLSIMAGLYFPGPGYLVLSSRIMSSPDSGAIGFPTRYGRRLSVSRVVGSFGSYGPDRLRRR